MNGAARSVGWGMLGHLAVPASTAVLVLGLPFVLDPRTYGYWQLYLFYALWLGYVTYGVPDGHHLRHAGTDLGALHPGRFAGKVGHLVAGVGAAMLVLAVVGWWLAEDRAHALMWVMACASTVLFVPRTLLTAALQAASRFRPFAAVVLSERGLAVVLTVAAFGALGADPVALAGADLLAKAVGLALGLAVTWQLLAAARAARPERHPIPVLEVGSAWEETRADAAAGALIVLANLAAVGAHGVLRLAVERRWGVVEFGQVSLAFSAALLLTTAAHAMGWLSLPRLARTPRERWPAVHRLVRDGTRGPLAALVLLYLPVELLLARWLPDYRTALVYVGLLLPLVVVETRWRVVTTGLLKVMRRQRVLLALNLLALGAAVLLALWFTLVTPSTVAVVLSLLGVMVLRSAVAEAWLGREHGQPWAAGLVLDLVVVAGLLAAMAVGGWAGAGLGVVVVAVATWWHRGATREMLVRVRQEVSR